MLVTIMTDASYCHTSHAAGVGVWIASNRGKQGFSEPISHPVESPLTAEAYGVIYGIYSGLVSNLVEVGDQVIIQLDCLPAINLFEGKRKKINSQEAYAKETFDNYVKNYALEVVFRHVRGHSNRTELRFRSNNICDMEARKSMLIAKEML